MRIILFLLLLLPVVSSEMVIDVWLSTEYEANLFETGEKNQSEKEAQDNTADESEKEYAFEDALFASALNPSIKQSPALQSLGLYTPYLEIVSPPPE